MWLFGEKTAGSVSGIGFDLICSFILCLGKNTVKREEGVSDGFRKEGGHDVLLFPFFFQKGLYCVCPCGKGSTRVVE